MDNKIKENELTKKFIKENLMYKNGKNFNTNKFKFFEIPKKYNWCINKSEFLNCILLDIFERPICKNENCNNNCKYNPRKKGKYSDFCSQKCSSSSKITKNKTKKNNLDKYGVEYTSQLDSIKEKTKKNNLEKYGVTTTLLEEKTQKKIKNTLMKKYGVDSPSKSNEVKEKIKKNNLKKYGVENTSQLDSVKKKIKNTLMEKYGVDHQMKSDIIKNKIKLTNIKKYGVDHRMKSDVVKNKTKLTNIKKYGGNSPMNDKNIQKKQLSSLKKNNLEKKGVEFSQQSHIKNKNEYRKLLKSNNINDFNKWIEGDFFLIEEFIEYFNITRSKVDLLKKKKNINISNKTNNFKTQKEILNYLNALNNNIDITFNDNNIIKNEYKFIELDIFLKEIKLAIEYNGLIFHSFGLSKYSMLNNRIKETEKKKNHLIKTELCEEKNIKLFHIFENEWIDENKQKIWKSMIKNHLKLSNKIYRRNTIIKDISKETNLIKEFLEKNHIQGYINRKTTLGLFDKKNDLVSLMSFGKPRYNKKYEYELLRFCSKLNNNVIGGGSKLLKYFERNYNPKSLLSYGNRRWTYSKENFYLTNGFEFINKSDINFYYFELKNINKLYHRQTLQKFKIKKFYEDKKYNINYFNEEETNDINLYKNNYRKIYDCGNLVYVKIYN